MVEPGSYNSNLADWQYYPLYNKPLGLFALLETPTIIKSSIEQDSEFENGCSYPYPGVGKRKAFRYKVNGDFKYKLNPSVDINESNTKIYAALVVKSKKLFENSAVNDELLDKNLQEVEDLSNEEYKIFITPFVPIEYLDKIIPQKLYYVKEDLPYCENYTPYEDESDVEVQLRLLIEYEFNQNSYGKINKTLQIYTYPVNLVEGEDANTNFQDINSMQMDYMTNSNLCPYMPYPTNIYIKAWNNIEISHTVSPHPHNPTTFKANSITLKSGAIIKPGVTLKTGLPFADKPKINQVSSSYLNSFCQNNYKAHLPLNPISNLKSAKVDNVKVNRTVKIENNTIENNLVDNQINIFPNPNEGDCHITGTENINRICIYSINGVLLYYYDNSAKLGEIRLLLDKISSGCKIVRLYGDDKVITKKMIIK